MIEFDSEKYSLVLRVVNFDMRSARGFKYPKKGPVYTPTWKPTYECGNGLHGWLKGEGDYGATSGFGTVHDPDYLWLVIQVKNENLIKIDDSKCKFKGGYVVFCGSRRDAVWYMEQRGQIGELADFRTVTLEHSSIFKNRGYFTNIKAGSNCYISVLGGAEITTEHDALIRAGSGCKIKTKSYCVIIAEYNNNIVTESNCNIEVRGASNIKCGKDCQIKFSGNVRIKAGVNTVIVMKKYSDVPPVVIIVDDTMANKYYRYSTVSSEPILDRIQED